MIIMEYAAATAGGCVRGGTGRGTSSAAPPTACPGTAWPATTPWPPGQTRVSHVYSVTIGHAVSRNGTRDE